MIIPNWNEEPMPYKKYKHDKFEKHTWKLKAQISQINDSSLKPEDKKKLKQDLLDILNSSL